MFDEKVFSVISLFILNYALMIASKISLLLKSYTTDNKGQARIKQIEIAQNPILFIKFTVPSKGSIIHT